MELNKKNRRAILGIITFAMVLLAAVWNIGAVAGAIKTVLGTVSFFIIGLCVAFILNTPMRLIELRLFAPLNKRFDKRWTRTRRAAALSLTVLLVLGLLFLVIFMVIPELGRTFAVLGEQIPAFMEEANVWAVEMTERYGRSLAAVNIPTIDWVKIGDAALDLLRNGAGNLVTGTVIAATSIVSGVVNFAVGFVLAMYVLYKKEKLAGQLKRAMYAFLPEKGADWLIGFGDLASLIFGNFISGQFAEMLILGTLCFIGMTIFGFPFAPMVSVLIGVTAFIPIFGGFIGMVVGAFMILVNQGAPQALWFIIFLTVLQQIENNLIYPHVVGKSVMLPGLWVLTAVTLGGNLAGIAGMLVSVPLASLLYALFREVVNRRNEARGTREEKVRVVEKQEEEG